MDAKTLEALRGSIRKWERIVEGTGDDEGPDNCPLCLLFYGHRDDFRPICDGCPVKDASGKKGCSNTPYDDYSYSPTTENAQRELDFLISLLPPGESKDA